MSRTYQVIFAVGSVLVLAVLAYWLLFPAVVAPSKAPAQPSQIAPAK